MFIFEELKKPVAVKATAWIQTDHIDENGDPIVVAFDWIAKFRRQTTPEEDAMNAQLEEVRAEAQEASALLPDDPDAMLPTGAAAKLSDAQRKLSEIQKQAVDYFVGWEIDNGRGELFPEDEETRSIILASKEFRTSLIEAWKKYLNPDPEELIKNLKTPPRSGRVVALPKKA